jgi:hypothetical protein
MRQFLFTNKTKKTLKKIEKLFSTLPDDFPKQTKLSKVVEKFEKIKEKVSRAITNTKNAIKGAISGTINKIKSIKWRKKKFRIESEASEFRRMRIESSFKVEEILNNIYFVEA